MRPRVHPRRVVAGLVFYLAAARRGVCARDVVRPLVGRGDRVTWAIGGEAAYYQPPEPRECEKCWELDLDGCDQCDPYFSERDPDEAREAERDRWAA